MPNMPVSPTKDKEAGIYINGKRVEQRRAEDASSFKSTPSLKKVTSAVSSTSGSKGTAITAKRGLLSSANLMAKHGVSAKSKK
jgi:hypothetical protein